MTAAVRRRPPRGPRGPRAPRVFSLDFFPPPAVKGQASWLLASCPRSHDTKKYVPNTGNIIYLQLEIQNYRAAGCENQRIAYFEAVIALVGAAGVRILLHIYKLFA